MKKEDLSYSEDDLSEDIKKIKEDINQFDELSNKLDVDIQEKYDVVKHFFNSTLSFKLESSKEDDEIFEKAKVQNKIDEISSVFSMQIFSIINISFLKKEGVGNL